MAIRGVVFDVDDTLFPERDYVRSGFAAVATAVESATELSMVKVFNFLWGCFERGNRGNTFDLLLGVYKEVADQFCVRDLVRVYRNHRPDIELPPESRRVLDSLVAVGLKTGIISDGPLISQSSKVLALGLDRRVDKFILTDVWGRVFWKPHTRAFVEIAQCLGLGHRQLCYVADNPEKDFYAPRGLGWYTVRVRHTEQEQYLCEPRDDRYAPDTTVSNIQSALSDIMERV